MNSVDPKNRHFRAKIDVFARKLSILPRLHDELILRGICALCKGKALRVIPAVTQVDSSLQAPSCHVARVFLMSQAVYREHIVVVL